MSVATVGLEHPPRPSPFAFPPETTFRFALVVAAVLGATLYVWNWMWSTGIDRRQVVLDLLACQKRSTATDLAGIARESRACREQAFSDSATWMLGGVALVVAVAVVLLLVWPWAKERRRRFRTLDAADAPAALAALVELSREAGLRREPRWVWNPLDPTASGVAFGRPGRYAVGLTGGLVVLHTTDPAAFRAILRHELAHIRNRDVSLTYATLALWYAFLLAAVLPFLLTLFDEGTVALSVAWRLIALAALVYVTRNGVLRTREVYADLRASVADGPQGALGRVVAALPSQPDRLPRRLLAVHPQPAFRVAALSDTRPLFRLGASEAFIAGLAATINFDSVHTLVSWWVVDPVSVGFIAALVFAPLVIGVAGVALWRERLGALAGELPVQPVWPAALALTAGLLVGPELSLARGVVPADRGLLGDLLHGAGIVWAIALLSLVLLLFTWIANSSGAWLRTCGSRRAPQAWAAGLLIAAGVLTIVFGAYYTLHQFSLLLTLSGQGTAALHAQVATVVWAGPLWLWQFVLDPVTQMLIEGPLIPLAAVLLWAFPLSTVLVRHAQSGDAPWAFLDPGGRIDALPPRARLVRPLVIGAACGAVCLVGYAALRGSLHAFMSIDTRNHDEFLLAFSVWQLSLAIAAQALAAAVATAWARTGLRLIEGLCAATAAGTVATIGILAGPTAGGCVAPLSVRPGPCTWDTTASFAWYAWKQVICQGAVAAIAAGLVVLGVSALVRTVRPADGLDPADAAGR